MTTYKNKTDEYNISSHLSPSLKMHDMLEFVAFIPIVNSRKKLCKYKSLNVTRNNICATNEASLHKLNI